jgi:uncharacterized protein (TIRG00374 family)
VIAAFRNLVARPLVRVAVRGLVSLTVIGLLVLVARRGDLAASLRGVRPQALALAVGLQVLAFVLNSYRWRLLLGSLGIRERLGRLTALYFIGQFCSLFLPTSAGGDAVRVYQVARRSGRPGPALAGTLQERLLGLGASLAVGLAAALYHWPRLPRQLAALIVTVQVAAAVVVVLLLYVGSLLSLASAWMPSQARWASSRLARHPVAERLGSLAARAARIPAPRPRALVPAFALAVVSVGLAVGIYAIVARSLQIPAGYAAFCLVVPAVWVVRMLPVSLNGIGVGESALVGLLGLFAVPPGKALALGLVVLALQTAVALPGGLVLVIEQARGTRRRPGTEVDSALAETVEVRLAA